MEAVVTQLMRTCSLASLGILLGGGCFEKASNKVGTSECPDVASSSTSSTDQPTTPASGGERVPWCHQGDVYDTPTIVWTASELAAMAAFYGTDDWAIQDANMAMLTAEAFCSDVYALASLQADGQAIVSTSPSSGSYGEADSGLGPLSLPSNYSLFDGLEFTCEMCGYYVIQELDPKEDPFEPIPGPGDGMTWLLKDVDPVTGVATVGCDNGVMCDPIQGDTSCQDALPLLCFYELDAPQPTLVPATSQYYTWSGGVIATTSPVSPVQDGLATLADADALCADTFGTGWRTAEFHDGWGWNFLAHGHVGDAPRFWVNIDDQPDGTCWTQ